MMVVRRRFAVAHAVAAAKRTTVMARIPHRTRWSRYALRASRPSRAMNPNGYAVPRGSRRRSSAGATAAMPAAAVRSSARRSSLRVVRASIGSWSCAPSTTASRSVCSKTACWSSTTLRSHRMRRSSGMSTWAACRTCCPAWRRPSSTSGAAAMPCCTPVRSTGMLPQRTPARERARRAASSSR